MVFVEIRDETLRESLAAFLDATFPGSTVDHETGLELDFHVSGLLGEVELRVVERLVWAWHTQEQAAELEVLLTASPSGVSAGEERSSAIHHRLRLAV